MSFLTGCGSCKLAKMPQAEEKSTAGFIFFLRFAEIIIVAVLAFAAKDLFELVRGHKELTSPPYNKNVLLSQELVYAGVRTQNVSILTDL
jgi:energy-coupling factor transporter transmembrane protein EcfT